MMENVSENEFRKNALVEIMDREFGEVRFDDPFIHKIYVASRMSRSPEELVTILSRSILELNRFRVEINKSLIEAHANREAE